MTHPETAAPTTTTPDVPDVRALADEGLALALQSNPVDATLLGLPGYDTALPDHTATAEQERLGAMRDLLDRVDGAMEQVTDGQEQITLEVLRTAIAGAVDTVGTHAVEFTITDSFFAPASMLFFSLRMVPIGSPDQAQAFLTRLAGIPQVLQAIAQRHREGIAAGRTPVQPLVESAIGHWERLLTAGPGHPLRTPTQVEGTGVDADGFAAAVDTLIAEVVDPAVRAYRQVLAEEVLPHARGEDQPGLCWLPGGAEHYAGLVRAHTTTTRAPQELHDTGLAVLAGLREQFAEIGARQFGTTDPQQIFTRLRDDPRLRWRDAQEQLDHVRATIRRAEEVAPQWFGRLPGQECTVRPVPESEAPGAPAAYYTPPAVDGSRPGIYWSNAHEAEKNGRYTCEAVTFHEAVPGHHFQNVLAQEMTGVPLLRRLNLFTAYTEGWGLYAEQLAGEMGLYSDDVAVLGQLSEDATRAARLVVDTGLHALGWSRQQVVDFLRSHTAMPEQEVQSETDRYIAQPGQALAYMTGRLEIERIRARAEDELGDAFDIRAFHDVVLGSGTLPAGRAGPARPDARRGGAVAISCELNHPPCPGRPTAPRRAPARSPGGRPARAARRRWRRC
ncbi:DUF885 domain-containing protein [Ornithinimicrobium murale]|uniref:DUF885 domain-containing protein n=1 Tax=Ornithinimicrobium murale TaxID=1050153 RepID=UPI000E0D91B3|nr:DUF885 domain-containing protein [Ornithinimicrobium murale]